MITLNPCWQDSMANHAFAKKSGFNVSTLNRWIEEVPPHVVSYLTLCTILAATPQDILDGDIDELCRLKGLSVADICFTCEFDPFSFRRELGGDRKPNGLIKLAQLYKIYGSFEQLFDLKRIKANINERIHRIENVLNAA